MLNVKILSDPICWVCFIGITAMDILQKEYDLNVEWLNINAHPHFGTGSEGIHQVEYKGSLLKYRQSRKRVKKIAKQYGLYLPYKEYVPAPQRALNAIYEAKSMGRGTAFKRLIMAKHHLYGEDIGDLSVISETAQELGIDGRRILQAVESGKHDEIIANNTAQAYKYGMKQSASGVMVIDDKHFIAEPFKDLDQLRSIIEEHLARQDQE